MKISLALVAGLLVGCSGGASMATPNPSSAVASATPATPSSPAREMVTVKGSGIASSKPFHLAGNYAVAWVATPKGSSGCYHGATLKRADGTYLFEHIGSDLINGSEPTNGETNLYNLDDADYYIDASSGCKWVYTFTPAE
jgi:hypothetical protein